MSIIDRDLLVKDTLDRLETVEAKVRDLQENSFAPPDAAVNPTQPDWSTLSGWVVTGTQLQDVNGRIILDPSTPVIRVAAYGYIESADFITTVSGFQINGGTAEFNDVVVRGTIYATVGEIGGWTIAATNLSNADATLSSTGYLLLGTGNNVVRLDAQDAGYRIWVGHAVGATAPFSVTPAGAVFATSGTVGGWTLGAAAFTGGDATLHNTGYLLLGTGNDIARMDAVDATYRLWIGHAAAASAPFSVTKAGVMLASSGTLGSLDITGVITVGSAPPYIEIDGGNTRIRTSNYVADSVGFNIDEYGNAEFNNMCVRGELRTGVLVYGELHATAGTLIVVKSASVLYADVTVIASPNPFNVDVKDPASGHAQIFAVGDILRMKDGAGDNWMTVDSISDQTTFYRYVCISDSGSVPTTFTAGAAIVDYDQTGDGGLLQTADQTNAPYMEVFTHAGAPWTTITRHLRLGNLNGGWGYAADIFGLAVGQYEASYANITVDPTNGVRLRTHSVTKIALQPDGDIFIGEDVSAAATTNIAIFTNAQTYNSESVEAGDILIGDNTASKANIFWDKSVGKMQFRGGTTMQCEIGTDGAMYAGGGDTRIDSTGIEMQNGQRIKWASGAFGAGVTLEILYSSAEYKVLGYGAVSYPDFRIEDFSNFYIGSAGLGIPTQIYGGVGLGGVAPPTADLWAYTDIRIGAGLYVGSTATDPDADDIHFDGNLKSMKNATYYDVYGFTPLTTPLTSTDWDDDAKNAAPTLIDLSAVFGVPAGVKAVLISMGLKDATTGKLLSFGPSTSQPYCVFQRNQLANVWNHVTGICPCDSNGDIAYTTLSTAVSNCNMVIWGYFI